MPPKAKTVTLQPGQTLTIKRAPTKKKTKKTESEAGKPKKAAGKKTKKTTAKKPAKVVPSLARDPITGAYIPKAKRVQHWMGLFEKEGLI